MSVGGPGIAVVAAALAVSVARPAVADAITVPFVLDHGRILIEVRLTFPDGGSEAIRAWVDNGNPELWITARLASRLALRSTADEATFDLLGARAQSVASPEGVELAGFPIATDGVATALRIEAETIAPGLPAEINLPAPVLRRYDLEVDFPRRRLTVARPGDLPFRGRRIAAHRLPGSELLRVDARAAGENLALTVDLGAGFSLLAAPQLERLAARHPRWSRQRGAVATALFWGFPEEATSLLLRLPVVDLGGVEVKQIGFAAMPADLLEPYRAVAGADSAGLLGAAAWLGFRVGIDSSHPSIYLEQGEVPKHDWLDAVGLSLRAERDGSYRIVGVPMLGDVPAVAGVRVGERLAAVDGRSIRGLSMGAVWGLLSGRPGERRSLTIEREGAAIVLPAEVRRFLARSPRR